MTDIISHDHEAAHIVELCVGTIGTRDFYAFLSIPVSGYDAFQRDRQAGCVSDLTIYGEILETGWGKAPAAPACRDEILTPEDLMKKPMHRMLATLQRNAEAGGW